MVLVRDPLSRRPQRDMGREGRGRPGRGPAGTQRGAVEGPGWRDPRLPGSRLPPTLGASQAKPQTRDTPQWAAAFIKLSCHGTPRGCTRWARGPGTQGASHRGQPGPQSSWGRCQRGRHSGPPAMPGPLQGDIRTLSNRDPSQTPRVPRRPRQGDREGAACLTFAQDIHGVPRLQVQVLRPLGRVAVPGHHLVEDRPATRCLWRREHCRAGWAPRGSRGPCRRDALTLAPAVPSLTQHCRRSPVGPGAVSRQALCNASSSGRGTQRPSPGSW